MRGNGIRAVLGALSGLMAVSAFGGGSYGFLTGAPAVPKQWLAGSPFSTYLIPSLILFLVVGGTSAVAANAIFSQSGLSKMLSLLAGGVQLVWIGAQFAIIGFVSWLQPVVLTWGALTLLLALCLPPD